ncbi:MAG: histidine phosphatase family protein [Planctomycetota bacterium]
MRHAKSAWGDEDMDDHERPLNERGRGDAPRIAARLAELGWSPDLVWSSDAVRTRETAERMLPAFDAAPEVFFDPSLYLAGFGALQDAAARWPDRSRTVLVLGHNPGWEQTASLLAGHPVGMTTANAVLFERAEDGADWAGAMQDAWTLFDVLRPKEL